MITGEYAALDGAKVLSVPTKKGQKITIKNSRGSDLIWESLDHEGKKWFNSQISLYDFSAVNTSDEEKSKYLQNILKNAVRLNSEFLSKWNGFKAITKLDFPTDWGLGSSATLINLVAQWAEINPLLLYFKVENGSGYDVATSMVEEPIIYFANEDEISYTPCDFDPSFKDNLYFVHLNQKQNTKQGIADYLKVVKKRRELVKSISEITEAVLECSDLKGFDKLIQEHESIISSYTGFKKVKDTHFTDYWGSVKSLGAWGGDFALATSEKNEKETKAYFNEKGFKTVVNYSDMV